MPKLNYFAQKSGLFVQRQKAFLFFKTIDDDIAVGDTKLK
jgi:energy-coupling factor transporter ATP-binding protein EcfA2